MTSRIEKVTVYSGRGKDPMIIPEGENPLLETTSPPTTIRDGPKVHLQKKHSEE
jgi:hypothetical protein